MDEFGLSSLRSSNRIRSYNYFRFGRNDKSLHSKHGKFLFYFFGWEGVGKRYLSKVKNHELFAIKIAPF